MKRKRVLPLCLGALFIALPAMPQEERSSTLEDLVRASLARNRGILALRQRVAQAQALTRQAAVRPVPIIQAEGASGRPLGSVGEEQFSAAFLERIETFGKRKTRVDIADISVAIADAEVDERSVQLAYEIETGYLLVISERERIDVLDRVSESLRESRRLTDARVREGDAAPLEAQLLAVEQSRAEAQRADATGRLRAAEVELRRVTGLAPTDVLPTMSAAADGRTALSLEGLILRAREKRADLRSARLLEQQGDTETTLARAEAHPDVTLSARYSYVATRLDGQYGFTSGGVLRPLHDRDNILSVGVSVPVMTKRRNQGAIEAAVAGAASARLRREYLESSIPLEVQSAYERWTAAMRTRDVLRDGVLGQSSRNLVVVREAYQLGQLRLLDVLNEQRRVTDMELSYLDARFAAARALADLERVTGGLLP